jgi:uncharacterized protein YjbI with pentapeptide repeats
MPNGAAPVVTILVGIFVIAVVIWAPPLFIDSRHLILAAKDQLDAEASFRTALIQLFGGLALIGGVYFTAKTFSLTREGQITDRYAKAIEQLGNKSLDVRIGGIYALERLAHDSKIDRSMIIEVLTTFIREHTRDPINASTESAWADVRASKKPVEADVQAAVSVLGRRSKSDSEVDLCSTGLSNASLADGNFSKAYFHYSTLNHTTFTRAKLDGAELSFCRAQMAAFNDCSAIGASFVCAEYVNSFFLASDFTNATFEGCDLSGSDFGRRYSDEYPNPPSKLTNAEFKNAILKGTNLGGVDLRTVRGLTKAQLDQAITDQNTLFPPGLASG